MKRNAMIRIIIWSICLILLSAMLFGTLALRSIRIRTSTNVVPIEYAVTYPPEAVHYTSSAREPVNIRNMPNIEAPVIGMLESGEIVTVEKEQLIDHINWSYISAPIQGWVQTEFISTETAVANNVPIANDSSFAFDAGKVHSLEIEWVAGHIRIQPTETDEILISESPVSSQKDAMAWKLKDGQLSIDFCEDEDRFINFGNRADYQKDLTIYVPESWECRSLEIDAAAATVTVEELTIREVDFDGASGACEFRSCQVERMDIDTASGDIRFSGQLGTLDCDAASADILAVLENVPSRIDVDTMSGDLDITLPQDAGFAVTLDSLNDTFSSEFADVTVQNGEYTRGNGACRINVNAMSGDVMIRKASSPAP